MTINDALNEYRKNPDLVAANPDVFRDTGKIMAAIFDEQRRNDEPRIIAMFDSLKTSKYRKPPTESEDSLLRYIIHLAHLCGWMVAHFRPAQTQRGQWVTAVAGDGAGFPDLVLVHPLYRGALFVECKSEKGKLSPAQEHWREWLEKAGCEYRLWRPADRAEIEKTLRIE